MFLKSLEIHGFKSFADKTKLNFNKGLTAVVGPNGSGKSNISDAIRWVLGEQSNKILRGSKMEDIIFSGTQNRKSQGFAEVSLTLDNRSRELSIDSDDVTITRRYYRSSESEYKINNNDIRLKDINELFMDTGLGRDGYSIIGQGRISEIIGVKSDERREIFEEACGITKFRYKKIEAERKLSKAEENLIRLKDIMSELEKRVGPLKIQSDKAKKYLELIQEKKVIEISIWVNKIYKYKHDISLQEDNLIVAKNLHDKTLKELEDIEKKIADVYIKIEKYLGNIESLRNQKEIINKNILNDNSNISIIKNDIKHNIENLHRIEQDISKYSNMTFESDDIINIKNNDLSNLENDLFEVDKNLLESTSILSNIVSELNNIDLTLEKYNEDIQNLTIRQSETNISIKNANQYIEECETRIKNILNNIEIKKNEISNSTYKINDLGESLKIINNKKKKISKDIDLLGFNKEKILEEKVNLESKINKIDLDIQNKIQSKSILENYEKNFEGFSYSVKAIMNASLINISDGIMGTVSSLINVIPNYSLAIEVSLGFAQQNIVVKDEIVASKIIEYLKNEKKGRVTLLPLSTISGSKLNIKDFDYVNGFIDIASNIVVCDKQYQNIMDYLLGRVVIASDLNSALIIAKQFKYKFKFVTLDGQVINSGGSLTGGSSNIKSGFISRKNDIIKLGDDIKSLTDDKKINNERLNSIQIEYNNIEKEIENYKSKLEIINNDIELFEKEKNILSNNISNNSYLLKEIENQLNLENQKYDYNKNIINDSDKLINSFYKEIKENEEKINLLVATKNKLITSKSNYEENINNLNIKKVEFIKDIDATKNSILEISTNKSSIEKTINDLKYDKENINLNNKSLEDKLLVISEQIKEYEKQINEITKKISNFTNERLILEQLFYSMRGTEKELTIAKERYSLDILKHKDKKESIQKDYDNIINKIWDEYQLTLSESFDIAIDIENIIKEEKNLNIIKSKIKSLGSINIDSIEEYKETNKRYKFLSSQINDVENSKKELFKIIQSLTEHMKELFYKNFDKINRYFNEIFVDIFGGGEAKLQLTGYDTLECGIEIYVQPPGKVIKSLLLLSGGEQTLVAICIYFAILKVRPSTFCILDEIDAALDDVNIAKYANYLSLMDSRTQFIMITHRRGSMEAADVLYGVTMQQEGVSKLLELNMSNLEQSLSTN